MGGIPNSTPLTNNNNEEEKNYYLYNYEDNAYSHISKDVSVLSFLINYKLLGLKGYQYITILNNFQ